MQGVACFSCPFFPCSEPNQWPILSGAQVCSIPGSAPGYRWLHSPPILSHRLQLFDLIPFFPLSGESHICSPSSPFPARSVLSPEPFSFYALEFYALEFYGTRPSLQSYGPNLSSFRPGDLLVTDSLAAPRLDYYHE